MTSSPKTVKSKSVLHAKPAPLARSESVWSDKWALGGRWTALKRLLHRRKRSFPLQKSCQSDFGGFPVTSSPKTVKSKSVLHTKPALLARLESVWSEKWALGGRWTALKGSYIGENAVFLYKRAVRAILEAFP